MSDTATDTRSPIDIAIALAKEAAEKAVRESAGAIATQPAANTNVAMPTRPGAPLKMDDMAGGMTVDLWLKVNEHGLEFNKKLIQSGVRVSIDMTAVQVAYAAKSGNPAQYIKTYDRVTEAKGGSWEQALAKAVSIAPGTREYRSADVPMTLLQDVIYVDPKTKKEEVVVEAGKTIGNSTSTTNWGNWQAFWRSCVAAGLGSSTVVAEISSEAKTNTNGNNWGVIVFTLIGPHSVGAIAA
jgi:hypothetical protein